MCFPTIFILHCVLFVSTTTKLSFNHIEISNTHIYHKYISSFPTDSKQYHFLAGDHFGLDLRTRKGVRIHLRC